MDTVTEPAIWTLDGRYKGLPTEGVCRFSAIPYAMPPVGPLRFAPPSAVPASGAPVDATSLAPIALQNPSRLAPVMGDLDHPQSEDCLSLTVWAPMAMAPGRPVLLWLHGGAFLSGGGAVDWYNGATLCREGDVVVVSPNYRLGVLGFLHSPGISGGNLGLLDAEMALQWVRENIASFGGDPAQITVVGQSAGAWLAPLLVARMPADQPTIRRLVLHSPPIAITPALPANAEIAAAEFLRLAKEAMAPAGPGLPDQALAGQIDGARLLAAQGMAIRTIGARFSGPGQPPLAFGLVADGGVLPDAAGYAAFLAQAATRVPVLVGWTRDEMNAFAIPASVDADQTRNAQLSHEMFGAPSLLWATHAALAGKDAFVFQFDWAAPDNRIGACHCIELPFLFGSFEAFASAPMLQGADAQEMQVLSRRMRAAWLAFVTHGDPNAAGADGLPAWPRFSPQTRQVMHIAAHCAVRARQPDHVPA